MFELFESIRSSAKLCRLEAATRDLEVVFPQSHLVSSMPAAARQYLEDKVWVLRDAILSRLENFLEQDALARCLGMAYGQYLAGRQWAEGQRVSINPATGRDAWINFVYSLAVRSFPAVDSNGALLTFLTEHLDQLSAKVASLADAPDLVVDPRSSRGWLARLASQTTIDEMLDFDSSPIIHLLELLIAEALHVGASAIAILPLEDRVEVAYRVQSAVYAGQSLHLGRLGPLLARLRMLTELDGALKITVGNKERQLRVALLTTDQGLAARLEILPDLSAIETCKRQAAELGYPLVQLGDVKISASLLKLLPKAVAWKKKVLPLRVQDGKLRVVFGTPPTKRREDELRLIFNHLITVAMCAGRRDPRRHLPALPPGDRRDRRLAAGHVAARAIRAGPCRPGCGRALRSGRRITSACRERPPWRSGSSDHLSAGHGTPRRAFPTECSKCGSYFSAGPEDALATRVKECGVFGDHRILRIVNPSGPTRPDLACRPLIDCDSSPTPNPTRSDEPCKSAKPSNGDISSAARRRAAASATMWGSGLALAADSPTPPPAQRKIKVGLVGCGGRGSWIAGLFKQHGGYEFVAAADYFQDRAEKTGTSLGVDKSKCFSGLSAYKRLIESGVEAVILETPPYFFPEHAAAAVEAGLHVYMAKPVAVDVPGAVKIGGAGQDGRRRRSGSSSSITRCRPTR